MSDKGSNASSSSDFSDTHPSTTTLSTVAVQAGSARIVLAILRVRCLLTDDLLFK